LQIIGGPLQDIKKEGLSNICSSQANRSSRETNSLKEFALTNQACLSKVPANIHPPLYRKNFGSSIRTWWI